MKKFCTIIFAIFALSFAFAKENPNAALYKTHETTDKAAPVVYFTKNISADSLVAMYHALGWTPQGKIGVKISTGEPPASNYLRAELISKLITSVNGTIVECNTAYGGRRAANAAHKQVAKDHFPDLPFDLLDENGTMTLQVKGGGRLKENYVGANFKNYGSYIILSHFKGHAMAGFGGAIKNVSIGFGSGTSSGKSGKAWIHSGGKSLTNPWGGEQNAFLESMAEAAKSISDYMNDGKNIVYINVLNRMSVDCDCSGNPAEPDMHDIGIIASTDPLAVDQAGIDLVYSAADSGSLITRIESRNGLHTLDHAEKIGLGKRTYRLVTIE